MTLRQLADAINEAEAGVAASVVQVTPGNYRLVLTSTQTGTENGFTFTSTLGNGITFGGADGTYGQAGDGNAVDADGRRGDRQQRARDQQLEHPHRRRAGRHADAQRRGREQDRPRDRQPRRRGLRKQVDGVRQGLQRPRRAG